MPKEGLRRKRNSLSQTLAADKGLSEKGRENGFFPLLSLRKTMNSGVLGALKTAPHCKILSLSPPRGAREREREFGGRNRSLTPRWENERESGKGRKRAAQGLPREKISRHLFRMPEENPDPTPVAQPAGDPPPAAHTVATGTEREETLAAELEAERLARRNAETRVAELEDENHRLKEVTPDPGAQVKRTWLDGGTFFHR